jgi:hypothetical protein
MAVGQATTAPVAALERTLGIDDPALRRRTFEDVLWLVERGYPGMAVSEAQQRELREWLSTAAVPEEWKRSGNGRTSNIQH